MIQSVFNKFKVNDLGVALKVLDKKNRVISENIANVDTPEYKSKKLDFRLAMRSFLGKGSDSGFSFPGSGSFTPMSGHNSLNNIIQFQNNMSVRTDGNDVNVEYEMSELASSSVLYQMFTEVINDKFSTMKEILRTR